MSYFTRVHLQIDTCCFFAKGFYISEYTATQFFSFLRANKKHNIDKQYCKRRKTVKTLTISIPNC